MIAGGGLLSSRTEIPSVASRRRFRDGAQPARAVTHRPFEGTIEGVVLCGGRSRRMGTDKALLADERERTLLERAASTLETITDRVVFAVGPTERYADHLNDGRRLVVDDEAAGDGPLAGLAAALSATSARWTVCLPVDMPGVDAELVRALIERANETQADLCLARGVRGVEPLLGVFGPRCADVARRLLADGERRPVALADPRHGLHAVELRVEGDTRALRNLNHPDDWQRELSEERSDG